MGNRNLIQRMEVSIGVDVAGDAEDPAFVNFNQVNFSLVQFSLV